MRNYNLNTKHDRLLDCYENPSLPYIGPDSYEEACARIEQGIEEMNRSLGYSWENIKTELFLGENVYAG